MPVHKGQTGTSGPASKYSEEVHQKIVGYLRRGAFRKAACGAARVSQETLANWLRLGDAGVEPYVAFALDVREAEAHVHNELAEGLLHSGKRDYRGYVEYGKVRFPDDYHIAQEVRVLFQAEMNLVIPRLKAFYGDEKANEIAGVMAGAYSAGSPALPPAEDA